MIGSIAVVLGAILVLEGPPQARRRTPETDLEIFPVPVGPLSMTVSAQQRTSDPLNLRFTVSDQNVTLLCIEIANQLDKGAETSQCVEAAPGVFVASLDPVVVQRWYNASPYWDGETKQLPIRVSFLANGQAASRTIWVAVSQVPISGRRHGDDSGFAWFLEGPCLRDVPAPKQIPYLPRASRR